MSEYDQLEADAMAEFEIKYPNFREEFEAKRVRSEALTAAWKARPVTMLSTLPFVGKTYRSRGRRSANKVSAWAVKPPQCTSEAAVLGAG